MARLCFRALEDYIKGITDQRKADFSKVVHFILQEAFHGPLQIDGLGTFTFLEKCRKR